MSGWQILLWGVVGASGALAFLKLVADEIELAVEYLRRFEERAKKDHDKRLAEAAELESLAAEAAQRTDDGQKERRAG